MDNPHRCKLCYRYFTNGRALGGHMRSHTVDNSNFTIPESSYESSSSFTSEDEDEDEDGDGDEDDGLELGCYELRENPKKSMKLSDVEFSSVSVTLSESESSFKINPTRKRSKRKFGLLFKNKRKVVADTSIETTSSMSPASSVSEVITSEEDVALCLMKLSRDNWPPHVLDDGKIKGKYTCLTCDKVFKSYQALGGHRASHKKLRHAESEPKPEPEQSKNSKSKIHKCPVCSRVFASAQALGGHKRTHSGAGALKSNANRENCSLIDLNLPAPEEEDEHDDMISLSAVSDPRFS